ncbi:asparagine synthase (glutamine-hydrolyzing) [Candidatus Dojkabacteria bacterium]|nr:asparagine synthase (glutamine-hydrolyzing) [Candidatus Dojkabacteria bacterium]
MCGINGFNFADRRVVSSMNAAIKRRGPDDQGIYVDNRMSLGHVRLSILDLSKKGRQPFRYQHKDRSVILVFNGEIYNYRELREELIEEGFVFHTQTDTEVIAALYIKEGRNCVKYFNGMWSFCVYDLKKEILFCSRDRLGQKPFFYFFDGRSFIFSSELKGLFCHDSKIPRDFASINKTAVELYFAFGYIPAPYSIFHNVFKLEAGHNLVFSLRKGKIISNKRYFYLENYNPIYCKRRLIKEGRELLHDAVKIRMRADVPVGSFLSGGLDSTAVTGTMVRLPHVENPYTFSVGFEGEFDETRFVEIARRRYKTNHIHKFFLEKDFEDLLLRFPEIYDEPFADYSGFPTYFISKVAKEKVTVVLSGDGGDEIFGGYLTHVTGRRLDLLWRLPKILKQIGASMPVKKNIESYQSLYVLKQAFQLALGSKENVYSNALQHEGIKPKIYQEIVRKNLKSSLDISKGKLGEAMRVYDLLYNTLGDNFLTKVDRASMANGLEVRSPFLDYRFAYFAQRIPLEWKVDTFRTKKLMREMIKGVVPKDILRRGKQGFEVPLRKWILKKKYTGMILNALKALELTNKELAAFFQPSILESVNRVHIQYKIRLLLYGLWIRRWIGL